MKRILEKISEILAEAAVLEMGVAMTPSPARNAEVTRETLEENLIEVAFAEEADYDDIHNAILKEHEAGRDAACHVERRYGDNDLCFRHAA